MAAAGSAYELAVLADAPWAYWPLDDASGTVAADRSGNGRPGTYSGAPVLAQPPAASFGGNAVLLPNGSAMVRTGGPAPAGSPLTLEAWVAFFSNPNSVSTQFGQGSSGANGLFLCSQTSGCSLGTYTLHAPGQGFFCVGLNDTPGWHLFHVVRSVPAGSTGLIELFIDGAQVWSQSAVNITAGASDISVNGQGLSNYGNGLYDEVAVYASALPQSRMVAHYQAAGAINGAPLGGAQGNQIQSIAAAESALLNEILAAVRRVFPTT